MSKNEKIGKQFMYYPLFEDKDFYEKIYIKKEFNKNKIPKQQKTTDEICNARLFQLAPQQEFLKNYISIDTPYNGILIYHGTGIGKCLAKDTPIIMYSGEIKKVQDVKIGDQLMGDDSTPRLVTSLAQGTDSMYKIIPKIGDIYTVNSEHIICCKKDGQIIEIAIKDYLNLSDIEKRRLKVYKTPIDFPKKEVKTFRDNIINCKEVRMEFLNTIKNFEIENNLWKDIQFLVRSLGLYAEKIPLNNDKFKLVIKEYDLEQDFTVEYVNEDEYYGFTLDGNCRFLFEDMTVTHNTCSAVQIAEGFKNVMKRMHSDDKRKITVLVSRRIMASFRNQIFDPIKDAKKQRPDEIVQCTGNEYSLDFEQFSGLTTLQKRKETSRAVNSVYKFYGYEQFANEIMNDIGWDGKMHTLTDAQKKAIRSKFTNRILIVDEIHNVKSEVGSSEMAKMLRKVPPILQAVIRYGENIRLVLMSATPMYDNAGEILYILNLLLENDGRDPIRKNEIFDAEDNLIPGAEERLKELSKGYISYLRGENPVVFPLKLTPINAKTPKIKYDIYGKEIPENDRLKSIKLYMCTTSKFQWSQYIKKLVSKSTEEIENSNYNNSNNNNNNTKIIKNDSEQFANSILRPLSNIILPNKANENTVPKLEYAYQKTDNGEGAFVIDLGKTDDRRGRRKTFQFRYQSHLISDYGTKNETPFLDEKNLRKYSVKFAEAFRNIRYGKGICYIYSEFVWGGVLPFSMMLEQNGFERYPWAGERPLLDYRKKRNPICAICGESALSKIHENTKNKDFHEFKRARYILVTGNANLSLMETGSLMNIINNENNKNGEEVKVIIGTRTTGEGLDFKRIRQVHVLEPWFNLSRIDQITGRGSRFCSHADLPKIEQNVEVFLYAIEPPTDATKKEKETETIDTRIYRLAEIKDRKIKKVEYILKQAAVDCALNKNGNIFDFEGKTVEMISSSGRKVRISLGDINGSRECDYRNCDYKCVWEPDKKKVYKINIDTYNERFAKSDIIKCKTIVKSIFKIGYMYKLDYIVKIISHQLKNLEKRFIYMAITEMINNINEPIYDMYDRRGYLIYRGDIYIFQPLEFNYLEAPMQYRKVTFAEKPFAYKFDEEFMEEQDFEITSPKNANVDKFELLIKKAEKLDKLIESDSKEKMYIILQMLVDKMNDKEKTNILKKIVLDYYETKGKMSNPYLVMLYRYFSPLLLFDRDLGIGKNTDKLIGYYYVFTSSNDSKNTLKIFCYNKDTKLITECSTDIRERIKTNIQIKLSKEARNRVRNFNIIYGFMTMKKGPYVFKIYDGTRETGAVTLNQRKSKRAEVKGKECGHHNSQELDNLIQKLRLKVAGKQSKINICFNLEFVLRKYDIEKFEGRRWFLNAIEDMKTKISFGRK